MLTYIDDQLVVSTQHTFPVLTRFFMRYKNGGPKHFEIQQGSMAKLQRLEVWFSGYEKNVMVGVKHLKNLKQVEVKGNRNDHALNLTRTKFEAESTGRPDSNRFIAVIHTYA